MKRKIFRSRNIHVGSFKLMVMKNLLQLIVHQLYMQLIRQSIFSRSFKKFPINNNEPGECNSKIGDSFSNKRLANSKIIPAIDKLAGQTFAVIGIHVISSLFDESLLLKLQIQFFGVSIICE
ncbi:hypothetical protein DERP_010549 [Dermatophagoides pteronyssinus]|uniref:Uncharacterized protein n=1 Tax=Dermatophagoides pteronyssinus TaxID=6956 RepID=A0ABQ8JG54_DERPT|nr:hypothetical protein DERP_010549 [Dermatophagoides pteronyssinus]